LYFVGLTSCDASSPSASWDSCTLGSTYCASTSFNLTMKNIIVSTLFYFSNLSCPANSLINISNNNNCICQLSFFSTGTVCSTCNYQCLECTSASNISCTSCDSSSERILNSTSCPCQSGYFDAGTMLCSACNSSLFCQ
jgi:hypothetical protein